MAFVNNTVPSSVRNVSARVVGATSAKPYLVAKLDPRLPQRARLTRLPHEAEDAKMTGMTRSLHRRLLALNLTGSLTPRAKLLSV